MVLPCASGALARGWMGRPLSNLRTQVLITLHSFNKDTHPPVPGCWGYRGEPGTALPSRSPKPLSRRNQKQAVLLTHGAEEHPADWGWGSGPEDSVRAGRQAGWEQTSGAEN